MNPFGPYDQFREILVSSRTERVRDLDVRIDTIRHERFLGRPGCETILSSNESHTAHVTRGGKYVSIYWSWTPGTDPAVTWSCMSNGPTCCYSAGTFMLELCALPPEAIR